MIQTCQRSEFSWQTAAPQIVKTDGEYRGTPSRKVHENQCYLRKTHTVIDKLLEAQYGQV